MLHPQLYRALCNYTHLLFSLQCVIKNSINNKWSQVRPISFIIVQHAVVQKSRTIERDPNKYKEHLARDSTTKD